MTGIRLDKWLWAARFFKTREQASKACDLNRILSNNHPAKPAREVHIGDMLHIKNESGEYTIEVLALSQQRGPASSDHHRPGRPEPRAQRRPQRERDDGHRHRRERQDLVARDRAQRERLADRRGPRPPLNAKPPKNANFSAPWPGPQPPPASAPPNATAASSTASAATFNRVVSSQLPVTIFSDYIL